MSTLEQKLEHSVRMAEHYKQQQALAVVPRAGAIMAEPALRFTDEQLSLIRDTYAGGASEPDGDPTRSSQ